jgi:hypothetical protein
VPIILHTGFAEGELMERARTFSPFTLLSKPCPPQQLIATVQELVERPTKTENASASSGDDPALLTA